MEHHRIKNKTHLGIKRFCNHCGGPLRPYRDSVTCLMCGRDADHMCKDCISIQELKKKSA